MPRHIGFVVGPALGHAGRALAIAEQIREHSDCKLTFITPESAAFLPGLVKDRWDAVLLPQTKERVTFDTVFADGLEDHLARSRFDLLLFDLNPLLWLSCARLPDLPRVFVTNVFLTRPANLDTGQAHAITVLGEQVNRVREGRGIGPLQSAYDLYEADRVLLADPRPLIELFGTLPGHYRACGACYWSLPGTLPDELRSYERVLLFSMGSSAFKGLGQSAHEFVHSLVAASEADAAVTVGTPLLLPQLTVPLHQYEQFPVGALLPQTTVAITHGGAGSTYQALGAGVPVIVAPSHRNHELLGELLERYGAGMLASKVGETLDLRSIRMKAAALRDSDGRVGPRAAAAEICALL